MDRNNRGIYDNALLGILSNEGQILPFLDVIFDFLYRRTDFFRIKTDAASKLGFPPGVAKKFVNAAFETYYSLSNETVTGPKKLEDEATEKGQSPPAAVQTVEVQTSPGSVPVPEPELPEERSEAAVPAENEVDNKEVARTESSKEDDADSNYDPVQARFQRNPESYNGAMRDGYSWCQSIHDLDVRVKVDKEVCSRNQVRVDLTHTHLRVQVLNVADGSWVVAIDDDLPWRIKLDECIWTLVPGDHILVNLEKTEERWWEQLLVNEPKINVRAIDPSKPFDDLDAESQAKIQELAYNNLQKQMGRKTPKEEKMESLLREAWDKEGSPFKGQPFNPDLVNINCDNL